MAVAGGVKSKMKENGAGGGEKGEARREKGGRRGGKSAKNSK